MKPGIVIVSLTLSTIILLLSVLYQVHWGLTLTLLLQILPILIVRDRLERRKWFTPMWTAWCGASFLGAWWLQASEGLQVEPVFASFGPGYLIIAVMALVFPKWFNS